MKLPRQCPNCLYKSKEAARADFNRAKLESATSSSRSILFHSRKTSQCRAIFQIVSVLKQTHEDPDILNTDMLSIKDNQAVALQIVCREKIAWEIHYFS